MSKQGKTEPTLSDVIEVLNRNQNTLEEVATWLKISGTEKVKNLLESTLDKPEKILVYHHSTESHSTREIETLSGVSLFAISSYQTSWFRLGLMKKIPVHGKNRYVKNFDLEDFGIKIPDVDKQKNQKTSEKETQPVSSSQEPSPTQQEAISNV
ncbi:MAG: hypothetical protein WAO91_02410 [Candidatus Nitrosotenuis sp.]